MELKKEKFTLLLVMKSGAKVEVEVTDYKYERTAGGTARFEWGSENCNPRLITADLDEIAAIIRL